MKKIAVISDPHLGQNGTDGDGQLSLLSYRVKDNLIAKLERELDAFAAGDGLTLVVTGDVFDLALAYVRDAVDDLTQLISRLGCVSELVLVIGNHDHHVWSLHCEEREILSPLRNGQLPAPGSIYRTTGPGGEPLTVLASVLPDVDVKIAYPSYQLVLGGGTQAIYFTHGHLSGGMYTVISDLLADQMVAYPHERAAATINAPLVELVYWSLGELGESFGADGVLEAIFTDLQKGRDARLRPLVDRAVAHALPDGIIPGIPDRTERKIVADLAISKIRDLAASDGSIPTSTARHAGIESTRRDLASWVTKTRLHTRRPAVSHIFYGHSHDADMWLIPSTKISAINLGSWLVEPGRPQPESNVFLIDGTPGSAPLKVTPVAVR